MGIPRRSTLQKQHTLQTKRNHAQAHSLHKYLTEKAQKDYRFFALDFDCTMSLFVIPCKFEDQAGGGREGTSESPVAIPRSTKANMSVMPCSNVLWTFTEWCFNEFRATSVVQDSWIAAKH